METLSAAVNVAIVGDASLEVISSAGATIAMIIRDSFSKDGINFLTTSWFPQHLADLEHSAGKVIQSHLHTRFPRRIERTQEVFLIERAAGWSSSIRPMGIF